MRVGETVKYLTGGGTEKREGEEILKGGAGGRLGQGVGTFKSEAGTPL